MCDPNFPRFTTMLYTLDHDDDSSVEFWMNDNIPDDYRVINVLSEQCDDHTLYRFFLERIHH